MDLHCSRVFVDCSVWINCVWCHNGSFDGFRIDKQNEAQVQETHWSHTSKGTCCEKGCCWLCTSHGVWKFVDCCFGFWIYCSNCNWWLQQPLFVVVPPSAPGGSAESGDSTCWTVLPIQGARRCISTAEIRLYSLHLEHECEFSCEHASVAHWIQAGWWTAISANGRCIVTDVGMHCTVAHVVSSILLLLSSFVLHFTGYVSRGMLFGMSVMHGVLPFYSSDPLTDSPRDSIRCCRTQVLFTVLFHSNVVFFGHYQCSDPVCGVHVSKVILELSRKDKIVEKTFVWDLLQMLALSKLTIPPFTRSPSLVHSKSNKVSVQPPRWEQTPQSIHRQQCQMLRRASRIYI
mmetsp:Transcript_5043/g.18910  ORF Transcript_5043/g.18910 Transcript_5043/m.18910 type:complete len:346 (+) Transcript_5043:2303-3340(+)